MFLKVLQSSIDVDPSTGARCIMALIDMGMERSPIDDDLILSTFNTALASTLPEEQKVTFAHRKIEFLEDYGKDVESVNKAQDELQKLAKVMREKKAAAPATPAATTPGTGEKTGETTTQAVGGAPDGSTKPGTDQAPASTNGAPPAGAYDQYAYSQQYNQYGNYANWNYQQSTGYGYGQQGWNAYQGYYG